MSFSGKNRELAASVHLVRRHRHLAGDLGGRPVLGEAVGRVAEGDLVAGLEHPLADLLAVDEGAVEAADVADDVASVRAESDPAVLLRHDAVEDLDRVVWMAPEGIKRGEDVLDRMISSEQDELRCHRQFGIVGQQTRRINRPGAGRPRCFEPRGARVVGVACGTIGRRQGVAALGWPVGPPLAITRPTKAAPAGRIAALSGLRPWSLAQGEIPQRTFSRPSPCPCNVSQPVLHR
jgi:hypothetical protein